MDIIKDYIIFDDIDSRDYGIEIFFQDIDRTPKRVYSKIEVPGRNGAVIIDEGRYEDVPVIYGCVALNDADRSAFVNALASKTNYFRLRDSFNPSEFYSAVFEGDVDPRLTPERDRSVFSISFTRKPERWLTDGEEHISVTSGQLIENPTLFDSKPMLEVEGYGTIGFNGFEIELTNKVLGNVEVLPRESSRYRSALKTFSKAQFNAGDTITILDPRIQSGNAIETEYYVKSLDASRFRITFTNSNENFSTGYSEPGGESRTSFKCGTWYRSAISFTAGTAETITNRTTFVCKDSTSPATVLGELYVDITISYNPSYSDDLSSILFDISFEISDEEYAYGQPSYIKWGNVTADSTLSLLGHPTYIDCDLGEAYLIRDNAPISLNKYIDLGSELPTLAVGSNEITYDNTITDLKVIPRWWIV